MKGTLWNRRLIAVVKEDAAHTILNVEKRVREVVVPMMGENEFFVGMEAKDVMFHAFAIGVNRRMSIPIQSRYSGGYSRKEYLRPREQVLIRAVQLADNDCRQAEILRDYSAALDKFEQYANGGFQFIEGELDRNVSADELANGYVDEMNKLYDEYMGGK